MENAMISELFRRRASAHPDRVAIRGWDGELSYGALAERADRVAAGLWRAGVRPGMVVGVHHRRSAATVACLLGILRIGAAYLALDHRDPTARLRAILCDAGVTVVLSSEDRAADLGIERVVHLDEVAGKPGEPPAVRIPAEQTAYVAYTSGSTGPPKGVCVPHRAVARLVLDNEVLPILERDVFLHFAPVAFDASTLEIWGSLLGGGRLVVPPDDLLPAELCATVARERVTVLWLTSGLFQQVVDTAGLAELAGLRLLLAGGDVLSVPHVNKALAALPGTTLVNGYGPTENTTFTCCHPVSEPIAGDTVPIGRPITGTTVRVLDVRLTPVAPGDVGELYCGGRGLAHGYLGAPAFTAGRFVPDPFAGQPGARMYRTGDLVRVRPDGLLDFVGRADRQVKIRGFRVELAEVESAVAALPDVRVAAVVAHRDPTGNQRIAAFVVGQVSAVDLRKRLADVLPDYAIPAFVSAVGQLPLTPNGKVDRAALAELVPTSRPDLSAAYRAPRTPLEAAVVQLWTDLLGIDGIGADDDFFELGGHSLIGVRILAELHRGTGVELTPLTFYLDPTPAGLARAVADAGNRP
jgi:amino acid adenylation domain-containing protein